MSNFNSNIFKKNPKNSKNNLLIVFASFIMSNSADDKILNQINDVVFTYCIPIICFAGIITNLLNAIVLSSRTLKNVIFQYYRMNAYSNIIYLTICFFVFTVRCGQLCNLKHYYSSQVYFLVFYGYVKGNT